jgi:hypothetical protein
MLKVCELGGSAPPESFQNVFDVLQSHAVSSVESMGASLAKVEPVAFLRLPDRTLMILFATSSIFDATVSVFSLAKVENVSDHGHGVIWAFVQQLLHLDGPIIPSKIGPEVVF